MFIEKYHYCEGDGTTFNILPSSIMYKTGYNQMTSNITVPQDSVNLLNLCRFLHISITIMNVNVAILIEPAIWRNFN